MQHMNDLLANLLPDTEPATPDVGQVWLDNRTNELLTWDGTYWRIGDMVRVETVVDMSATPAADHDIGWNVPAGFDVVKASARLLKTITGAAGGVKVGFGTKAAGDPDKYGLTADLNAGTTDQTINPTWNNGAADDLGLTACDAGGAAAGTIAGSADADVRVMVWMRPIVTLPS